MANNEVTNFMYYIFNRWSEGEAVHIFGENLGKHIFSKYVDYVQRHLGELRFYAELDNGCKQKMVDRANEIYGDAR